MTKRRMIVVVFAVIGAVLGAGFGIVMAPTAKRYTASADVAMLPAPNLTTAESSSFWEVLTRGQISRTAAIVYEDRRWLASAAKAANVGRGELTLTAGALPETSILTVTVTANSSAAAEAALSDVLTTAAPQVGAVTAPFVAKVLSPTQDTAYPVPVPGRMQVAAFGALAGLLGGGVIGWYFLRRRSGVPVAEGRSGDIVHTEDIGQGEGVVQGEGVSQGGGVADDQAKHRGW